jgi:hypothetical protein
VLSAAKVAPTRPAAGAVRAVKPAAKPARVPAMKPAAADFGY